MYLFDLFEDAGRKLVIFDIDDTLVNTNTRVIVRRDGEPVHSLNSQEFTHYKLKPGETFDFGAFRDAEDFFQHAQPIAPMIEQLKNDIATGNRVVMVTARADFNSKEIFLKTFEQWHVDMSKVHVYRAGNDTDPVPIDEKKARIIRRLLTGHAYSKVMMYDDSVPNLESFVRLHNEYPGVKFYAWHVDHSGRAREYTRGYRAEDASHNLRDKEAHFKLVDAIENWVTMYDTPEDIETILMSPESRSFARPPAGVQWLYRAVVPKNREFNTIKAKGHVVAFATRIEGAIAFVRSLDITDPWVIIRKRFNPADFLLDFSSLRAKFDPDEDGRFESEYEVWMRATPNYSSVNNNEVVLTSKEYFGEGVTETIRHVKGGYKVFSKKGKNLGGPYPSHKQAARRLGQVEYFKHMHEDEDNGLYELCDRTLVELCSGIIEHQKQDADKYGLVAAAVIDPERRVVKGINYLLPTGKRVHAERAAIANYIRKHGAIPADSMVVTTLSPCANRMSERDGPSCTELLNDSPVTRVYAGYQDPTQRHLAHDGFDVVYTQNAKIESVCKSIADCFLKEETPMDPAGFRGEAVEEGVPQPGPSSGAPKKFGPDAKITTRKMTVGQIISSIPGVPYYNNVVDDWDAKDYHSWNVTEKAIEYAKYFKKHPESLAQLDPIIVLNGKFEDGAHRVSAIWLLQQRMDPKNPLWANAKLNVQFVEQGVAEGKVKLFTDPSYFGAEIDDTGFDNLPVVNISVDRLVGFEPDDKMNQLKSKANVEKIVAGLKQGAKLPPLLVRKYKDGYQVLDGHHRFWAYKLLGTKSIPSRIVPDKDIEEISKQGVAEGGAETSWSNDTDTITLQDILELTKHIKQINLPINDNLKSKLLHWEGNPEEIERVNQVTVSNQFPILIMVNEQGQIEWILDGNHRLHKAIQSQAKTIPAKLIRPNNLNDKAKKIFNIKEQGVAENFADGKNPGRKGLAKRSGVNTKASVSSLRKTAKHSTGEKARMAHWLANMKAGKAKAKKK